MTLPRSITTRLSLSAIFIMGVFLSLAGASLYKLYQQRLLNAVEGALQSHVYTLLSAAREDAQGLPVLADVLSNPRFNQPDSGLYAALTGTQNNYQWQSASMLGQSIKLYKKTMPGETVYHQTQDLMVINFSVQWDDFNGRSWPYTFSVATSLAAYEKDIETFIQGLWTWLGGSALLLATIQLLLIRWGLTPLRQAAADIKAIENGMASQLEGDYPTELIGLTGNINSLIEHSNASLQRYRNSLGDLAHSLKTPLALLQSASDQQDCHQLKVTLAEQLPHIDQMVQYQLQRASVRGRASLPAMVVIKPLVEKTCRSLAKVYYDKALKYTISIADDSYFKGDLSDLMELLGNLLDNAFKYGHSQVRISLISSEPLQFIVEDDGPGIDEADREILLQRGQRADESLPGQGLGLSIVNEIIHMYQARLKIDRSELGGARFQVSFPS